MGITVTSLQCKCQIRLMIDQGNLIKPKPIITQKTNKKETPTERRNPLYSEIPEWLQEFREILVDDEIPVHGGAEKFGDLISADHKVLSDNCESRNNHRFAVVVQDLATQWIQSYPCTTKTSQETQRSLQKFLEPERKPKVIYTDNSLELAKLVKISPGIIARLHHTDRRQTVLPKEQCAE